MLSSSHPPLLAQTEALPECVQVRSQTVLRIDPGDTAEVLLRVRAAKATALDPAAHALTCAVRGGRSLVLRLNGSVVMPDVEVKERAIEFGDVTIGGLRRMRLTLFNRSAIATEVAVDLTDLPQFFVTPPTVPGADECVDVGG